MRISVPKYPFYLQATLIIDHVFALGFSVFPVLDDLPAVDTPTTQEPAAQEPTAGDSTAPDTPVEPGEEFPEAVEYENDGGEKVVAYARLKTLMNIRTGNTLDKKVATSCYLLQKEKS